MTPLEPRKTGSDESIRLEKQTLTAITRVRFRGRSCGIVHILSHSEQTVTFRTYRWANGTRPLADLAALYAHTEKQNFSIILDSYAD